jgi:hypothetical protein
MPPSNLHLHPLRQDAARRIVWALFAVGLLISLLMVARSQVAGDQLNLLARGWLLAEEGTWISYGNPMSTGGKAPGGITSLLVGLPLLLWQDHRAPTLLVLLFHVFAYLILDGTLKRILTPRERVLLALLFWLNPWRLYFSAFLWNPNYLFLFGAVHLWSCLAQRERPRFWPSFLHGVALALAFQIHASFLLLFAASALLWWRRYWRPHWIGGIVGGVLASLPLIPWALELVRNPSIVTEADKGFLGRGLVLVFPLLRGLLYWLRYASLALSEKIAFFDFQDLLGEDPWLGPGLTAALRVLLPLTLILPLLGNVWLWRRRRRRWGRPLPAVASDRVWLQGYAVWSFVAAAAVFALSPTTIMMWQGLLLLHAAILPVILWAGALGRTRLAPRVSLGMRGYAAAEIVLLLLIAFGSPQYRCLGHDPQGRDSFFFPLAYDHPMLHELGIQQTCPWPLNRPGAWWPDVLPVPEDPRGD